MNRNLPFTKYLHDTKERIEVPMHEHTNGQLNYVHKGSMRLLSPDSMWVVPRERILWIPPDQAHSVHSEKLSGSWKIMIPRSYREFLPKKISVLKTSELLVAALGALPTFGNQVPSSKLKTLKEIIRLELQSAEAESFGVILPTSAPFAKLSQTLLRNPGDPRRIDDWAESVGMSRRTFTRHFFVDVGSSFEDWRKSLILNISLNLLSEGVSVSDVSERLGYASPSAFIAAFRKKYGKSPLKMLASGER